MESNYPAALARTARAVARRRATGCEEGVESGFTLIELMVVLLIMAILLAIAIPTFLGVKGGAQNRTVQSDLTNAVTSAKAVYSNAGSYGTVASTLATTLHTSEPELTFVPGAVNTGAPHQISVLVSNDGLILLIAEESANSRCWYAEDNEESAAGNANLSNAGSAQGITYGSGTPSSGNCNASDTPSSTPAWGSRYPAS